MVFMLGGIMDYNQIAKELVQAVGGSDNIASILSCFTRVRIEVKDKSLVDQDAANSIEGAKGSSFFNNTFQVIFGGKCNDVFDALAAIVQIDEKPAAPKHGSGAGKNGWQVVFDYIAGSIQPIITVLIGCGMIQAIVALLAYVNIDTSTYGYQVLNAAGTAGYYFLPVFLGFSSARKLGVNPFVGATLGAVLVYPSMLEAAASGESFASLYGIPVRLVTYSSTMTPILLSMPLVLLIERFAKKISPTILKSVLVPTITILVSIPVILAVTGPVAQFVSELLGSGIQYLYSQLAIAGGFIIGATAPYFVLTGIHQATAIPIVLNELASAGFSLVFPILGFGNAAIGGSALGVALKTKNAELRSEALSSALIASVGITEPALYGVLLPTRRSLIAPGVMGGLCGAASLAFGVKASGLGLCGIGGIPLFLGSTFVAWCVLMLIAYFGAAAITYVVGFDDVLEEA